ncbi:hypothetical protein [Mesorhizobium sp. M2E.F.Ca.ET.219.01.1.1]|uniref:hypothetical protein n=1 Tax=Mesorhizobium sp. M2E.F.Ca.ET.219.01.1.1 TaxID=2500530 RepID=UPI001FE118F4|nr:hypothetical protein [Mesorhizobium sp. M2E.F.Ca.ET.219.01.1.1]
MNALDEAAPSDRCRQVLDRGARLDASDVVLGKHQLVEGNVARGRQGDLLNGVGHRGFSETGAESLSLGPEPVTDFLPISLSSFLE